MCKLFLDPSELRAHLLSEEAGCIVFTNGCFDLLHRGHVEYLQQAKALGDILIVALNSDDSVRRLKGPGRPLMPLEDRAVVVAALSCVDYVTAFDDPTPAALVELLQPDVLVKGGDWPVDQMVGRDVVLRRGGRVLSIPSSAPALSATRIMERIRAGERTTESTSAHSSTDDGEDDEVKIIIAELEEGITARRRLLESCLEQIVDVARLIRGALQSGNKVLLCGNGGSAADAQHIAAELVGRFRRERRSLPAIALTTDSSILTAVSNDYGFEQIFARQVEALVQPGDVVVGISTSGHSANVLKAMMTARERGALTAGLTGSNGIRLASICDASVMVPSNNVARVQEIHIAIGHLLCELIESATETSSKA